MPRARFYAISREGLIDLDLEQNKKKDYKMVVALTPVVEAVEAQEKPKFTKAEQVSRKALARAIWNASKKEEGADWETDRKANMRMAAQVLRRMRNRGYTIVKDDAAKT